MYSPKLMVYTELVLQGNIFYEVNRLDVLTGNLYFVQQIIYLIKKDLRMYNVVIVSENR